MAVIKWLAKISGYNFWNGSISPFLSAFETEVLIESTMRIY